MAEEPQVSPRVKELEVLRDRVLNPERHVAAVTKVAPKKMAPRVHRVKRGETLSLIAARNNMTLKQIALMNDMTVKSKIRIGQIIKLHKDDEVKVRTAASKRVVKVQTKPLVYKLQRGETLTDVARWFNTSVDALKSANNITKGRQLHVGHKVKIPATRRGTYTVRPGDYLIKIAQKFGLNQTALMKLNNLKRQSLYAGQRLVVNLE